jgi:hypothetical protein
VGSPLVRTLHECLCLHTTHNILLTGIPQCWFVGNWLCALVPPGRAHDRHDRRCLATEYGEDEVYHLRTEIPAGTYCVRVCIVGEGGDRWFGPSYEKCRECDAIEFHFTLPPNVTTHFSFGKDPDPSSDAPGTYLRLDVYYDDTKSLPIVEQEFGTFVCLKCVSYIRPSSKKKNPE